MPKHLIKRYMPDHHKIRNHRYLQFFGTLLHDPNLWHLNRRSVSGAFAVGLFVAFIPIPFQMVLAAAIAIAVRVNLPVSVGLVWVTNPITMPPLFYITYKLGTWLLDMPVRHVKFEPTVTWLMTEMGGIWKPFLLGSLLLGAVFAALGYLSVRMLWRLHVVDRLRKKREKFMRLRRAKRADESQP